jgi:enoyl-CoA hydratase/carnithine racemase
MKDLVTVEPRNGYAIVRLDRPEKMNAMNRQARRELLLAYESIPRSSSRPSTALLWAGAPR